MMVQQAVVTSRSASKCDPAVAITKSLLGYAVIAMPIYVVVSVIEGLTRDGFNFAKDDWSLLANGNLGGIHVANLVLSGAMVVAGAIGFQRATHSTWGPRLLAGYGVGFIVAGILRADPANGFPVGTTGNAVSWHGVGHLISAGLGFACLIAACFVLARGYASNHDNGWARFTRTTGVLFGLSFFGIAGSGGAAWSVLFFTAAVILVSVWMSATAVREYRRVVRQ
jgi:Protein of unknown function (DUF998)